MRSAVKHVLTTVPWSTGKNCPAIPAPVEQPTTVATSAD
jgi:hypothetical protein